MKRHVLFVDHSSDLGGGQLGLLRYLKRSSRFERSILVLGEGEFSQRARALGIPVRVLPAARSYREKILSAPRVKAEIESLAPDIVVTNSIPAANIVGLFSDPNRKRIAYLREELSPLSQPSSIKRMAMFKRTLATFDGFLSNSKYTASTLPPHLKGLPGEVAFPVSGTAITDPAAWPPGPLTVASLSRLDKTKGIHVLLDAIKLLALDGRDVRALIAGGSAHSDPSYARMLKDRVAAERLPVELLGHVEDVQSVIDRSHVLALCTLRPESFGQVMIQALASGRPVVATSKGGPVEVLGPRRSGVLVPSGDAEALATGLALLDDSREELDDLRHRGLQEAERFADDVTAPGLDDAIAALDRKIEARV